MYIHKNMNSRSEVRHTRAHEGNERADKLAKMRAKLNEACMG